MESEKVEQVEEEVEEKWLQGSVRVIPKAAHVSEQRERPSDLLPGLWWFFSKTRRLIREV